MKKILLLCLFCFILLGCNNLEQSDADNSDSLNEPNTNSITTFENQENSEISIDTNIPTTSEQHPEGIGGQGVVAIDGYHHEMYYSTELMFIDHFIGLDEFYDYYRPIFQGTMDVTYRGICEYYGISKEEYVSFWESQRILYEQSYLAETYDFEKMYPVETKYDAWFVDEYETDSSFIPSGKIPNGMTTPYIAENREDCYTIRYYTIDGKLLDYVGSDKWEEYLSATVDVNILTFIEFFSIDREEYLKIYAENTYNPYYHVLYPYHPDYLFSPEKTVDYFTVHAERRK